MSKCEKCVSVSNLNLIFVTLSRIGFALTDLPAVIATIKDIVKKTPTAFPLKGLIFRFSGKSDIYMSTSYERDTVHMEFLHWKRSDVYNDASGNLAGYQTILQALVNTNKKYIINITR